MATKLSLDEKLDSSADHLDDVEVQKDHIVPTGTDNVRRIQSSPLDSTSIDVSQQEQVFDPKETKRILRKVDFRLIPVLALLYLLAFLDRMFQLRLKRSHGRFANLIEGSNIANARVAGMNEELGLSGSQYNMALTV